MRRLYSCPFVIFPTKVSTVSLMMVVNQKQREDPIQCIKASLASPKIVSSYIHAKTKALEIDFSPRHRIIEKICFIAYLLID